MSYLLHTHDQDFTDEMARVFGASSMLISHSEVVEADMHFDYKDLVFADYTYINWKEIPPLDQPLLDNFSECERIFLKMVERVSEGSVYDERKRIFHKHLRFWNWKISKIKKTLRFAVFDNIPHEGYDFIIYCVLKYYNIKTFCFFRLPTVTGLFYKRFVVDDIYEHGKHVFLSKNHFSTYQDSESVREKLNDEFKHVLTRHESKDHGISSPIPPPSQSIERSYSDIISKIFSKRLLEYLKNKVNQTFMKELLLHARHRSPYFQSRKAVKNFYSSLATTPNLNEAYIYIPLHFQPELSTSPIGKDMVFQELMVSMVAWVAREFKLKVLVKEHPRPSAAYSRNIDFYTLLKNIEGVELVTESFSGTKLLDSAVALASISGSSIWEAFLRDKPSIVFGTSVIENAPGVYKVDSIESLRKAFIDFTSIKEVDKKLKYEFLLELQKFTFDGIVGGPQGRQSKSANISSTVSARNAVEKLYKFSKQGQHAK